MLSHNDNYWKLIVLLLLSTSLSWAQTSWEKCDPVLRHLMLQEAWVTVHPVRVYKNGQAVNHSGATVQQIAAWHGQPEVQYIESLRRFHPMLNISLSAVGADLVHAGVTGQSLTGQGVLIGIVDSGIDWRHADFIDAQGQTRIAAIWDQTDLSGNPPAGYNYGSFYSKTEIQAALEGTGPQVGGVDTWGHGTHVAGIAAGNGRATGNGQPANTFVGVAPGAELVIVKGGDTQFIENQILDGLAFCYGFADALSKPIAVNLSVGSSHYGPHDGTSFFESSIDEMLWSPGRMLVISAGNDGQESIHFKGETSSVSAYTVSFAVGENATGVKDFIGFDIWADHWSSLLELSVITPSGDTLGPVKSGQAVQQWEQGEGRIYLDHASTGIDARNNSYHTWLRLSDAGTGNASMDNLAAGTWTLRFIGATSSFDGWLYEHSLPASLTRGGDHNTLLPEPANAYLPMTVGGYTTRENWPSLWADPWGPYPVEVGDIAGFSSPGPTRDGRRKPDLAAPGEHILSALAATSVRPTDHYAGLDSVHSAWAGTSMAAPHVTGAAALLFELDPTLGSSQIKSYLINSASQDAFTGNQLWDGRWGRGKLNVLAAVSNAPVDGGEKAPDSFELLCNFPNPFNPSTTIQFFLSQAGITRLDVFNVRGCKTNTLVNKFLTQGSHQVLWNGVDENGKPLPSGVYFYCLNHAGDMRTQKMMLLK